MLTFKKTGGPGNYELQESEMSETVAIATKTISYFENTARSADPKKACYEWVVEWRFISGAFRADTVTVQTNFNLYCDRNIQSRPGKYNPEFSIADISFPVSVLLDIALFLD